MGIQAGADGGAADGELVETGEREFDIAQGLVEQAHIAGEFLPECERGGILEVRAADLDDVGKGGGFGVERVAEFFHGRDEGLDDLAGRGDGHRRREGVVRRLRHVHIVIWMHWLFGAFYTACDFDGAIRDNLVGVHVALSAGAGLPDAKREVGVEFSRDDFIRRLRDEIAFFSAELAEVCVREGGGLFQNAESLDHLGWQDVLTDVEMNERTGGLRAPVGFVRNGDFTH